MPERKTKTSLTHTSGSEPTRRIDMQNVGRDMIGKVLGKRYEIQRRIGIGGMAIVYEARDATLDRPVAVKMMLPQYAEDENFTERFYLEAKSAAKLQSNNIVSVYDWGFDQETSTYYIVMELLDGTDLKHGIIDHGALSCRLTAEIAMQVSNGLAVAHANGIIHRDIKPQNIMVMPDRTVKIMDFGIARPSDVHLTSGKNVLGTAQYISPEQTRGMDVTPASDIYSLGIVMYECVTGKVPFDGKDAITVALKQVKEAPVPPVEVNPQVDAVMNRIILKCMAKDPKDRFTSAQELKDTLSAYIRGENVDVSLDADATQPMNYAPTEYDGEEPQDEENGRNKRKIAIIVAVIIAILAIGGITFATMSTGSDNENTENVQPSQDVPNVIGMAQDDAKAAIEEAGFTVGDVTEEYSDDVDDGKVISQSPTQDDGKQTQGTSIDLVVSKGKEPPKTSVVPSLTGLSQADATSQLKQLGFEVSVTYGNSDTIDDGKVMDQNPSSNTSLQVGSTVTITISKGADTVTVPTLTGMPRADAQQALEGVGLSLGTVSQSTSDTVESGGIISQDQQAGSKVKKGTSVNVTVSTGREMVNVGTLGLIGKTLADAKNSLNALGVSVTVSGSNDLDSIVQDVSPMQVEKGGEVTVTTKAQQTNTSTPSNTGNIGANVMIGEP